MGGEGKRKTQKSLLFRFPGYHDSECHPGWIKGFRNGFQEEEEEGRKGGWSRSTSVQRCWMHGENRHLGTRVHFMIKTENLFSIKHSPLKALRSLYKELQWQTCCNYSKNLSIRLQKYKHVAAEMHSYFNSWHSVFSPNPRDQLMLHDGTSVETSSSKDTWGYWTYGWRGGICCRSFDFRTSIISLTMIAVSKEPLQTFQSYFSRSPSQGLMISVVFLFKMPSVSAC